MYLISACLCGVNCKYNGLNNYNEKVMKIFKDGMGILVCPEQLGGLTTPREPSEILYENNILKVFSVDNKDVTTEFIRGASEVLRIAKTLNVKAVILKEGSPSCGKNFIYDGTFSGKKIKGEGVTAKILRENNISVISDEEFALNK